MNDTSLGSRIRGERRRRNLTQEQLAEKLGVTATYIGFIERGQRGVSLDTLQQLAAYFGVTLDYLMRDAVGTEAQAEEQQLVNLFRQADSSDKELIMKFIRLVVDRDHKDT